MKTTITILLTLLAIGLSAQRQYTSAQITAIDGSADEGDLYHDTVLDIVYIGLMDGSLIPIKNTDDQAIQTFSYDAATQIITLLLEDGGGTQTISLDTLAQDLSNGGRVGVNQTINISGGAPVTFSVADNDNSSTNEIQDLDLSGNDLTITNNGSATTIDLSPYLDNSDSQDLTDGGRIGVTQTIDISGGNSMSFSVADNDNSSTNEIQDLDLSGNDLTITNNGSATTIDLSPYLDNEDDQTIDSFALVGSQLQLGLESDINGLQTVDLTGLQDADWFEVGGTSADNILDNVYTFGNVGININNPQHALHVDNGDPSDGGPWAVIEGGGNVFPNVALQLFDKGEGADNVNILEFAHKPSTSSSPSAMAQIKTRTHVADHATGADLILESASDNAGTLNSNQLVLDNGGNVGVGTNSPAAKLDVDNGSVRFSDYGIGTYAETEPAIDSATYVLGVNDQGDVVEMNTAKSSKIFYPPAIVIDVSELSGDFSEPGLGDETLDLHEEYVIRYGGPAAKSTSAPAAIPTYEEGELYYYVTDYDTSVFTNVLINDLGVMTYDIKSVPANNCTFINVVFVVK